jgi:23S rRNA-/tRNA-specific pseudouridylate synthase
MRVEILYEDDGIIVLNKPAGMLVIPTPKQETYTLTNLVNKTVVERGERVKVHPCHRIDREASGVIVYARGKRMQKLMMDEFRKRRVWK